MSVNLRFSNWLREFLCKTNYLSALEESIMTKAKAKAERVPTDEAYEQEKEQVKAERVKERLDTEMKKVDKEINERLNELANPTKLSNHDLIFQLIPATILFEIYTRLEEGSRAIEENKRIKAALDNVNEAIKKMFNLV